MTVQMTVPVDISTNTSTNTATIDDPKQPDQQLLAAVDLGSNSFRLMIGRVVNTPVGQQIYPLDSLKESVRLAAGLSDERELSLEVQQKAIKALQRFGERLRSFHPSAVRVVGTNTLRIAKNIDDFIKTAQVALGFPIEIIAGREEARLIYNGVIHSLPSFSGKRLVVDIGGGSTECIIGQGAEPIALESLNMGCVSWSLRYFKDGEITKERMRQAELAAEQKLLAILQPYTTLGWEQSFGSSGTARALGQFMSAMGWSQNGITREGMMALRDMLIKAGNIHKLKFDHKLEGRLDILKSDRLPVLPGGFAIMSAIFKTLDIEYMQITDGALRQGVLYDLLGRVEHHDMRDLTVTQFKTRYQVDEIQAQRIATTAKALYRKLKPGIAEDQFDAIHLLTWAANLHEVGLSIAHNSYHKHSAYILTHADMPGFSKWDQTRLAAVVLGHWGKLAKLTDYIQHPNDWWVVLCLRLAVLFHRRRDSQATPELSMTSSARRVEITLEKNWLGHNPLTEMALIAETQEWRKIGWQVILLEQN
jgi:exopolyphosphatase/guanosine-5'-triphosphate,3'-diphosphate pyrophosphatase